MSVYRQAIHQPAHHSAHGLWGVLVHAYETWLSWNERMRYRRELSELDDHMLQDLGVDRQTVEYEIRKPFWRG